VRLGERRRYGDGATKKVGGFVESATALEHKGEMIERGREIGSDVERAPEHGDAVIAMPLERVHHAEEVERLGVVGIDRQRSFVAGAGGIQASRAVMVDAGGERGSLLEGLGYRRNGSCPAARTRAILERNRGRWNRGGRQRGDVRAWIRAATTPSYQAWPGPVCSGSATACVGAPEDRPRYRSRAQPGRH
jgi:hypothetical protein